MKNNILRIKMQLLKIFTMEATVIPDRLIRFGFAAILFAIAFFLMVRAVAPNGLL